MYKKMEPGEKEETRWIRNKPGEETLSPHTHILSEGPPSLEIHVRPDIDIAKLMPRPITSPSVPRRVLGFVDEDEPCQRRTRVMNSVRELPPDISTVLGHHRYSERVPSDVYAVFREPRKCF